MENVGETLEDRGIGNAFLYRILITQKIRTRIKKWDYCCIAKETTNIIKRKSTEWEKNL
jgi:hypothetical protein